MPVRRATNARTHSLDVNPLRFRYDDGVGPDRYFGTPGYPSISAARQAWAVNRPTVWASVRRFRIPHAAAAFDGLTVTAWPLLWACWNARPFPADEVNAALDADEQAAIAFEARDPKGARAIAPFLQMWRHDMSTLRTLTRELADCEPGGCYGVNAPGRMVTSAVYGSRECH